jgi:hypothetical protein
LKAGQPIGYSDIADIRQIVFPGIERQFVKSGVISGSRVPSSALVGHAHFLELQATNHGMEHGKPQATVFIAEGDTQLVTPLLQLTPL